MILSSRVLIERPFFYLEAKKKENLLESVLTNFASEPYRSPPIISGITCFGRRRPKVDESGNPNSRRRLSLVTNRASWGLWMLGRGIGWFFLFYCVPFLLTHCPRLVSFLFLFVTVFFCVFLLGHGPFISELNAAWQRLSNLG